MQKNIDQRKTLIQIFGKDPYQWGLRGDPYLWQEMKNVLADHAYPDSESELIFLLEQTYEQLVGKSIKEPEPLFVERFAHGGMSSGYVDPRFWTEKGFPLLLSTYRETK
jgi:hypothetical protein